MKARSAAFLTRWAADRKRWAQATIADATSRRRLCERVLEVATSAAARLRACPPRGNAPAAIFAAHEVRLASCRRAIDGAAADVAEARSAETAARTAVLPVVRRAVAIAALVERASRAPEADDG